MKFSDKIVQDLQSVKKKLQRNANSEMHKLKKSFNSYQRILQKACKKQNLAYAFDLSANFTVHCRNGRFIVVEKTPNAYGNGYKVSLMTNSMREKWSKSRRAEIYTNANAHIKNVFGAHFYYPRTIDSVDSGEVFMGCGHKESDILEKAIRFVAELDSAERF